MSGHKFLVKGIKGLPILLGDLGTAHSPEALSDVIQGLILSGQVGIYFVFLRQGFLRVDLNDHKVALRERIGFFLVFRGLSELFGPIELFNSLRNFSIVLVLFLDVMFFLEVHFIFLRLRLFMDRIIFIAFLFLLWDYLGLDSLVFRGDFHNIDDVIVLAFLAIVFYSLIRFVVFHNSFFS